MNLNEFAKEVHALAVEKGFYDEQPSEEELIAAIHGEISEALEEWRDGRPNVYHECGFDEKWKTICKGSECRAWFNGKCMDLDDNLNPKPEGVAVELIDVALRILDAAAAWGVTLDSNILKLPPVCKMQYWTYEKPICDCSLPQIAVTLHQYTTNIGFRRSSCVRFQNSASSLELLRWSIGRALDVIFKWLRAQETDPEALMLEKHEYNKTRPYRHGGKRI